MIWALGLNLTIAAVCLLGLWGPRPGPSKTQPSQPRSAATGRPVSCRRGGRRVRAVVGGVQSAGDDPLQGARRGGTGGGGTLFVVVGNAATSALRPHGPTPARAPTPQTSNLKPQRPPNHFGAVEKTLGCIAQTFPHRHKIPRQACFCGLEGGISVLVNFPLSAREQSVAKMRQMAAVAADAAIDGPPPLSVSTTDPATGLRDGW